MFLSGCGHQFYGKRYKSYKRHIIRKKHRKEKAQPYEHHTYTGIILHMSDKEACDIGKNAEMFVAFHY